MQPPNIPIFGALNVDSFTKTSMEMVCLDELEKFINHMLDMMDGFDDRLNKLEEAFEWFKERDRLRSKPVRARGPNHHYRINDGDPPKDTWPPRDLRWDRYE